MSARAIIGYLKPSVERIIYSDGSTNFTNPGLSKRDLFSSMFLQGILNSGSNIHAIESNCKLSVIYAEALLKELDNGEKD